MMFPFMGNDSSVSTQLSKPGRVGMRKSCCLLILLSVFGCTKQDIPRNDESEGQIGNTEKRKKSDWGVQQALEREKKQREDTYRILCGIHGPESFSNVTGMIKDGIQPRIEEMNMSPQFIMAWGKNMGRQTLGALVASKTQVVVLEYRPAFDYSKKPERWIVSATKFDGEEIHTVFAETRKSWASNGPLRASSIYDATLFFVGFYDEKTEKWTSFFIDYDPYNLYWSIPALNRSKDSKMAKLVALVSAYAKRLEPFKKDKSQKEFIERCYRSLIKDTDG